MISMIYLLTNKKKSKALIIIKSHLRCLNRDFNPLKRLPERIRNNHVKKKVATTYDMSVSVQCLL